jgi:hypothetical protein
MRKMRKPTQSTFDINNIHQELRTLQKRRETWEDGLYRSSNRELYEILNDCYRIYSQVVVSNTLKSKLNEVLKNTNVTQTKGSSLQIKVIRYVFGEFSEQFTYARVVKEAYNQQPTNFVQWLTDSGGPSGVKKKTANTTKNTEAAVQAAKRHYENAVAFTTIPAIDELRANADADHTFALALVRVSSSDPTRMEVVFGTNSISLTDKVLELAAKKLSPEQKSDALAANERMLDTPSLDIQLTPISPEIAA